MRHARLSIALAVLALVLLLPSVVRAQSSFTGVVKDTSGAVLPGVTVEVSSPVLIEKIRSVSPTRRPLHDRRPAARHLQADVYPVRIRHAGARRHRAAGATRPCRSTSTCASAPSKRASRSRARRRSSTCRTPSARRCSTREVIDALPTTRNMQSVGSIVPGVKISRPDVGGSQRHGADLHAHPRR